MWLETACDGWESAKAASTRMREGVSSDRVSAGGLHMGLDVQSIKRTRGSSPMRLSMVCRRQWLARSSSSCDSSCSPTGSDET